jgi:hypothetical protein
MAARIGRCANELFCSIASAGEDVLARDGEAFVCPKCGKPLFDGPAAQGRTAQRAVLIGVAVVTLTAGGFIIGRGLVVGPPAQTPEPAQMIRPASVASVAAAPQATPPGTPPTTTPAPAPLAQPAAPSTPQPASNLAVAAPASQPTAMPSPPRITPALAALTPQPVPSVVAAAPAPPPASQATRPVPQKVALLTPSRPITEKPPAAAPPQLVPPPTAAPAPPPKPQVVLSTPTPPRAAEPAAPRGDDRPFHAAPVAGGAPVYPHAYEEDGRAGSVTISCTIQTSGFPSGCRVLNVQGGSAFSAAVIKWVSSGRVRFAPILRNGQPVAETHQWAVSFAAP